MDVRRLSNTLVLALSAMCCAMGAAQANDMEFYYRLDGIGVKPADTAAWQLSNSTLPRAVIDRSFSFSFPSLISPLDTQGLSWSASGLPGWATLDPATGNLAGTPSGADAGSSQFTVTAVREHENGQQTYTLVVGDEVLEVSQLAVGARHSCAVTTAGAAKCWGSNAYNQLGDGTSTYRTKPVQVFGLDSGIAQVTAGGDHSCALSTSGAVLCWGGGRYGQIGDGFTSNRSRPVAVVGLASGVSQITGQGYHTCAVLDGSAKCWGYNYAGQLGDGSRSNRLTPRQVQGLESGVSRVLAGDSHSCAIAGGAAKCWGANDFGQLGDGSTTARLTATQVIGLESGAVSLSTHYAVTCAIVGGAGKCWGLNEYGQLGDGTTTNRSVPTQVVGLESGVTHMGGGNLHGCAVVNGAAKCWGYNSSGQLGDGSTTTRLQPVQVAGLDSGVSSIAAGSDHSCAEVAGGVKCWGSNYQGLLGNGTTTTSLTPVDVKP